MVITRQPVGINNRQPDILLADLCGYPDIRRDMVFVRVILWNLHVGNVSFSDRLGRLTKAGEGSANCISGSRGDTKSFKDI